MATKKELIQAQAYSRRRLLTAFTSGIPGGKELEPAKPLRAVVAGVALSVLLILGSLILGLINPGLPTGWDNNALIIAKGTGARYLSVNGTLYPVLNTTSARLLVPSKSFSVLTLDPANLEKTPRGETIGILGAPDALPKPMDLTDGSWAACAAGPSAMRATLGTNPGGVRAVSGAMLVSTPDEDVVIAGSRRYPIARGEAPAVLRALGISPRSVAVPARWLNLFEPATALTALDIPGAGQSSATPVLVDGRPVPVGTVLRVGTGAEETRFVLTQEGELAPLSPVAYQLYLLGTGTRLGEERTVAPSQISALRTATTAIAPEDWPAERLTTVSVKDKLPCAQLTLIDKERAAVSLAVADDPEALTKGAEVRMPPASGALVRAVGDGANGGLLFVVDSSGTAYAVPGANAEVLARLGFKEKDVSEVPSAWVDLFQTGPELSEAAAGQPLARTGS